MKKNIVKIIGMLVVVMILVILLITNIFYPCNTGKIELYVSESYGDEEAEFYSEIFYALIDRYNGKEEDKFINEEQLVRTNPELPSNKEVVYKSVAIDIEVSNRSFFELTDFSATVEIDDPDSRVLYTYGNEVTEIAPALKDSTVCVMWMKIYCGDLTDEELLEYIRGLDIVIYYDSSIAGVKEQRVSLSEAMYRE